MTANYRDFPILVEMLEYWQRKRGERAMPRRADIDPVEIPGLLPHLRITEVIDGGARYRYRLVGTAVVEAHGADYTGRYTDEILKGDNLATIERTYATVRCAKRPLFMTSLYTNLRGLTQVSNRLLLPLSESGAEVSMIIAAFNFGSGASLPEPIRYDHPLQRSSIELL